MRGHLFIRRDGICYAYFVDGKTCETLTAGDFEDVQRSLWFMQLQSSETFRVATQ